MQPAPLPVFYLFSRNRFGRHALVSCRTPDRPALLHYAAVQSLHAVLTRRSKRVETRGTAGSNTGALIREIVIDMSTVETWFEIAPLTHHRRGSVSTDYTETCCVPGTDFLAIFERVTYAQ